jgi:glutaconate CoA-transferase subunit A
LPELVDHIPTIPTSPQRSAAPFLLTTMADAIATHVHDGDCVVLGAALEALIPFAAGHELIRQGRKHLTLIGPISDMLFDQLIGAGCVDIVEAAWVGNVSAGLGHNYRRATEHGEPNWVRTRDHSNFSISLALLAGAMGVPYLPTRSLLGSDIVQCNGTFREALSPFDGKRLVLVPAIVPDVAILHVQRADSEGHAHIWGNLGITHEAFMASQRVILVAEEIVDREVILSDPNRILGPAFRVSAVVHEPGGAHPSPVQGYYNRDHPFFHEYHKRTRLRAGWEEWAREWIWGVPDRAAYLRKLGTERWSALGVKQDRFTTPVNYGW